MNQTRNVALNIDKIVELFGDKIYNSDGSAFREQVVNAISHGVLAYQMKYNDTDAFVEIVIDHSHRKVTVVDNGMGMPLDTFYDFFASFGNSKNTDDGKRSGQHGLGAMSFLRLSSSTIVESKTRETDEHYCCIIEDGKTVNEVPNRTLTNFGTKIEMTLKEKISISELRSTVKNIAKKSPVKIIFRETNTEYSKDQSSSIDNYGTETESTEATYTVFPAKHEFIDCIVDTYMEVDGQNGLSIATIENNDGNAQNIKIQKIESIDPLVEIYITSNRTFAGRYGAVSTDVNLCRVPIELSDSYDSEFRTYCDNWGVHVNILDERKYAPEHHRDHLTKESSQMLVATIKESIENFIQTIQVDEPINYYKHPYQWIINKRGVDPCFNAQTLDVLHQLRATQIHLRYDNKSGKQGVHWMQLDRFLEIDFDEKLLIKQNSLSRVVWENLEDAGYQPILISIDWYNPEKKLDKLVYDIVTELKAEKYDDFKKRTKLKTNTKRIARIGGGMVKTYSLDGSDTTTIDDINKMKHVLFVDGPEWNGNKIRKMMEMSDYTGNYEGDYKPVFHIINTKKHLDKINKQKLNPREYITQKLMNKKFAYSQPYTTTTETDTLANILEIAGKQGLHVTHIDVQPLSRKESISHFPSSKTQLFVDRITHEALYWQSAPGMVETGRYYDSDPELGYLHHKEKIYSFDVYQRVDEIPRRYGFTYYMINNEYENELLKTLCVKDDIFGKIAFQQMINLLDDFNRSRHRRSQDTKIEDKERKDLIKMIATMANTLQNMASDERDIYSSSEKFMEIGRDYLKKCGSTLDLDTFYEDPTSTMYTYRIENLLAQMKSTGHKQEDLIKEIKFDGYIGLDNNQTFIYKSEIDTNDVDHIYDILRDNNDQLKLETRVIDGRVVIGQVIDNKSLDNE